MRMRPYVGSRFTVHGSRLGATLVELLVAMSVLAVGLAATAGAFVNIQQSIHRAFHQTQANHILEELLNQVRLIYADQQSGVGLFGEAGKPIVDNFFALTGTNTANPRLDASSQSCTNDDPDNQNCLFKFYNRDDDEVQNIKNGNDPFPCPVGAQLSTTCFDPDPADDDPTVFRIEWQITDQVDDLANTGTITKGAGTECDPGGGDGVLYKLVTISVRWVERGVQVPAIIRSIKLGC